MKTVSIIQSSYIPWRGYFDIIGLSDEFVILDTVQFTRRDWRNRNRIKGAGQGGWLTIPVISRGRYSQTIEDTEIADPRWARKHWTALKAAYGRQPGFGVFGPVVERAYLAAEAETSLSAVNRLFIEAICGMLDIRTPILSAGDFPDDGAKSARLLALCEARGAGRYLSGPSAAGYLDEAAFADRGIAVSYMDYAGYPDYAQPVGPFDPAVSILDLLFCAGEQAASLMKFPAYRAERAWA